MNGSAKPLHKKLANFKIRDFNIDKINSSIPKDVTMLNRNNSVASVPSVPRKVGRPPKKQIVE